MKVLIGTPIHQVKDYSIPRWLQSVAELQLKSRAHLLIVDNSPGADYAEKVREYCLKYQIQNYNIIHVECGQGMSNDEIEARIEKSQDIIRHEVLSKDYDAWFSWECDEIIPANALNKLIKLQRTGDFMIVTHNSIVRADNKHKSFGWGLTLVKKECIEKYGFLLPWVSRADYPDIPDERKHSDESSFQGRVLRNGGSHIEVDGIIKPIYHLDNGYHYAS